MEQSEQKISYRESINYLLSGTILISLGIIATTVSYYFSDSTYTFFWGLSMCGLIVFIQGINHWISIRNLKEGVVLAESFWESILSQKALLITTSTLLLISCACGGYYLYSVKHYERLDANLNKLLTGKLMPVEAEKIVKELIIETEGLTDGEDKAIAYYIIASSYDVLDRFDLASQYYVLAAQNYPPDSADRFEAEAQAAWSKEDFLLAKKLFEMAYEASSTYPFVLHNYGYFIMGVGKKNRSIADPKKALVINQKLYEIEPSDEAELSLAMNYILLDREDESLKVFGERDISSDGYTQYWLGRAYFAHGNTRKAHIHFKTAAENGFAVEPEYLN